MGGSSSFCSGPIVVLKKGRSLYQGEGVASDPGDAATQKRGFGDAIGNSGLEGTGALDSLMAARCECVSPEAPKR